MEDYIETCRQLGKSLLKSYNGSFNVGISPEIQKKTVRQAIVEGVSLNKTIEKAIAEKLK